MKKVFLFLAIAVYVFALSSCNQCEKNVEGSTNSSDTTVEQVENNSDNLINATLWVQHSSEYYACCYQAFNYAKLALDNKLKQIKKIDKPLAVVFDIDETILDNSYYEANLIETNTTYTKETWKEWSDMESATAIPGAIEFLNYVNSRNVEIVYVSNRRENELEASFNNLKALGFPEVSLDNYYFRTDESSKINRRKMVSEKYNIILLLGDNLADFDGLFEDRSQNMGKDIVSDNKHRFGVDFIILPNPMYGKWERALPFDKEKSNRENRINSVKGYSDLNTNK